MNKPNPKNLRVRKELEDALFSLMERKPFSQITVTDLITEAHVSRASYYRNFQSKEDIIIAYLDRARAEVGKAIHASDEWKSSFTMQNLITSLNYYLQERDRFLALYRNGFGTMMIDQTNFFGEYIMGDMPAHSADRYKIYYFAGGALNMAMQWLEDEHRESPEEMAEIFFQLTKDLVT